MLRLSPSILRVGSSWQNFARLLAVASEDNHPVAQIHEILTDFKRRRDFHPLDGSEEQSDETKGYDGNRR